jgi:hypothetical protein
MKQLILVMLLAWATPAVAAEWVTFSMGEGADLKLDKSSIRRDTEGRIAPWGRGWLAANTLSGEHGDSPGYFVTDCKERYYVFRANRQTGAVEDEGAQPLRLTPGSVAYQMKEVVCSGSR